MDIFWWLIGLWVAVKLVSHISSKRRDAQLLIQLQSGDLPTRPKLTKLIQGTSAQPFKWTRTSEEYLLYSSDSDLLARLYLGSDGHLVEGESFEGRWGGDTTGIIRVVKTGQEVAKLQSDIWHGNHSISFPNGRRFVWKREGSLPNIAWTYVGGLLLTKTTWMLVDERDVPMVLFRDYEVRSEPAAAQLSELPWLVLLGSLLMIQIIDFSDVGG
jgi:hypothetical protein